MGHQENRHPGQNERTRVMKFSEAICRAAQNLKKIIAYRNRMNYMLNPKNSFLKTPERDVLMGQPFKP